MHANFLSDLLHFVAACFTEAMLDTLSASWVLNEHMYTYVLFLTKNLPHRPIAL